MLSTLSPSAQLRYFKEHGQPFPLVSEKPASAKAYKPLDHFSAAEREEIRQEMETLARWQEYRRQPGRTAELDAEFVELLRQEDPGRAVSVKTLYRKKKALEENDLAGLVDGRGKARKGRSSIDETVWQAFLSFYLDLREPKAKECYWEDERYTVAENLLEAAQKKVDASAVPVRSYSCGVVDLAKAWRYEEGAGSNIYAHLNIQLLTVATLLDTRRGTRIDHQVVQYKRYPHYPDLNVVTLSTKAPTITTTVKQLQDAIENPSSSFRKQMQSLINQMAAGISGHDGGTMEITFNSDGKPNGIRWGDGDDLATSQKVLWLNLEGIAYGQNGVNGDYSTVWSFAQNGFVADWIVVGTLTANLIKTGLLQSKNGKSWINLDTGAAQLAGTFLSGTDAFLAELSGGMLRFSQNGTYVGGLYSNTWGDQKTLSFSGSAVHVRSRIDDAGIALSAAVQGGVTGEIKSQPSLMVFDGKGQVISLQIADGESKIIFNGYECTLKERTVDGQTIRYLGAL